MKSHDYIKEALELNAVSLEEASTSRLVSKFVDDDIAFAIISACRPNEDNKKRTAELKRDVRNLNLGFNEFIGRWVEDGESFDETSLLITNIPFKKAFELGQRYNQSSIIYKDKNGVCEICTTPFETYKVGDVVKTYHIDPDKPLNIAVASEIFAGRIGGPASLLIKGSNKKAFNFKESFELYERQLLNTRLGFTESKLNIEAFALNENSNTRVKKPLFGDITGKISTFALLTVENPLGKQMSAEENNKRTKMLKSYCKKLGIQYIPITGSFGNIEHSFMLINLAQKDAEFLAKKFG